MKHCLFLLALAIVPNAGCDSQKRIEQSAERTAGEERSKLPISVGHSVELAGIDYNPVFNEINLHYQVANRQEFDRNYSRIKIRLDRRVRDHDAFSSLLKRGVTFVHQFKGGAREGENTTHTQFQTQK